MQNILLKKMESVSIESLLRSWLALGLVSTIAALLGLYYPFLSWLLLLPATVLFTLLIQWWRRLSTLPRFEKILIALLVLIWISHFVGVLTPETGFDAVWYHLPVINAIVTQHTLTFVPELYQSVNPLFADLIFGLGYMWQQDLGAKMVAYGLGLTLAVLTYAVSRQLLERSWALLVTLLVSTFQVVAWQSSSFYVDVAKATWELGSIWYICRWLQSKRQSDWFKSLLFFSASLGTKLFSIFLFPLYVVLPLVLRHKSWVTYALLCIAIVVPLPFYLFALQQTGSPVYSLMLHTTNIAGISGAANLWQHFISQTWQVLTLPWELVVAKDYTSFVLVLLSPILLWALFKTKPDRKIVVLTGFTLWQLLLWWYLPPVSTRYALSGFIILAILTSWAAEKLARKHPAAVKPILATYIIGIVFNLLPRVYVNARQLTYLFGQQTKQEYLQQFLDGNIDLPLKSWHKLNE